MLHIKGFGAVKSGGSYHWGERGCGDPGTGLIHTLDTYGGFSGRLPAQMLGLGFASGFLLVVRVALNGKHLIFG